jgi:hypothetical protein
MKQAFACIALVLVTSCNGLALPIGSNEPEDPAATCADPWPDDESTASPDAQLERRATLGVGRWIACAANPASSVVPPAFDVTETAVYPLRETVDGYEREPAIPDDMPYSVRAASLVMTLEGVQFEVRFRDTPRGMTLAQGTRTYRFVP